VVRGCLGVAAGDLYVVHAELAHGACAVALAEAAYRAGASLVEIVYSEPRARAARIRHAADEHLGTLTPWEALRMRALNERHGAFTTILADAETGTFDGLPPERVAADFAATAKRMRPFRLAAMAGRRRWVGISWPTPVWAERVYPELGAGAAERRLARDLLHFCRLGPGDPPGYDGWLRHRDALVERARALTALELRRLRLRGPGTDLSLRLVPGTRWLGGGRENAWGALVTGNFPTEETFTSPEAAGTSGTFRCSRPLSFRGRVIDGIAGEFRRGRLVRLEASSDGDRDFLAAALDTDRGARRLGEIALVDRSSRIGQAGRTYANTLIDENAAAHIAFGFPFQQTRLPDPKARGQRGLNRSDIHLDVMIGTDDFEATGWAEDGREVPLLADGTWQL
jgi:aminopeptidase